jgi:hypothetical protein
MPCARANQTKGGFPGEPPTGECRSCRARAIVAPAAGPQVRLIAHRVRVVDLSTFVGVSHTGNWASLVPLWRSCRGAWDTIPYFESM